VIDDERSARVLEVLRDLVDPDLGPDDDFFEAGGTSLLVVRAIAQLKAQHGLRLNARAFIADSRVAAIVASAEPLDPAVPG